MTDLSKYRLIIFDVDGTLAEQNADELLPDAKQWLTDNANRFDFAIATNQGGVGLRHWMEKDGFGEPDKYPTEASILARVRKLIDGYGIAYYICFAYQSKKSGKWSPTPIECEWSNFWKSSWRKPANGMLVAAMDDRDISPEHTLMVGDRDEDREAAKEAGCDFMLASDFFGRDNGIPF